MRRAALALIAAGAALGLGCSSAEGEGEVSSERLYVAGCWDGPFWLSPDFFAANPFADTMLIRVQRGDNIEEVSDGLIATVNDVPGIRRDLLGTGFAVGLPPGVSPPGVDLPSGPAPLVSLGLYLNATCHRGSTAIYSLSGSMRFDSLFSGDPNEGDADDRLTDAVFSAWFGDPRDADATGAVPAERQSLVEGHFRFYFQRGQPAQPFP